MFLVSPAIARADVVLNWNATMLATVTGQSPFATARFAAITQLAVFEAVNAITGEYEPYLGTIIAPAGASPDAAAAAAAHAVLKYYFPAKAASLDAALAVSLAAITDGDSKADGIATGEAAAAAMIALRASDGSAVPAFYAPEPAQPGLWQPTPSCPAAGGTNFHWRDVAPFGVPAVDQFRLGPPPALSSGEYSKDYNEVKALGAIDSVLRNQDRADVAQFYAMFSPVSWSNSAARQMASAQGRSLSENARALALLGMALSDAAVTVFDTKYYYKFWRPETAIHAGDADDNQKTDQDITFVPFIAAPCFPSYPSAHGTLSAAAAEVLERVYGPAGHDITFSIPSMPSVILNYTTLERIVADISDARVYGGIHFRFDQEAGAHQGKSLGAYIYKHNLGVAHP
jgi:hypothetical protein